MAKKPPVVLVRVSAEGVHSVGAPITALSYTELQKTAFLTRLGPAIKQFDRAIKKAQESA